MRILLHASKQASHHKSDIPYVHYFSPFICFHMKAHGGGGWAEGWSSIRAQSQDVWRSGQCSCFVFSLLFLLSSLFPSYDSFLRCVQFWSTVYVSVHLFCDVLRCVRLGFALPVSSFAWELFASLAVEPVTWFAYGSCHGWIQCERCWFMFMHSILSLWNELLWIILRQEESDQTLWLTMK